jgi:hypothetical protein
MGCQDMVAHSCSRTGASYFGAKCYKPIFSRANNDKNVRFDVQFDEVVRNNMLSALPGGKLVVFDNFFFNSFFFYLNFRSGL